MPLPHLSILWPVGLGSATLLGFGAYHAFKKKKKTSELPPGLTATPPELLPPPDEGTHPLVHANRAPASLPMEQPYVQSLARRFTRRGPRGELVFIPETAQTIQNALRSMIHTHPRPNDPRLVQIHPEPTGLPPAPSLSASHWLRTQNQRMSVLAPVHMGTPTSVAKFLRLASPGHEAELAPYGYAVLSYAGTHRPSIPSPVPGGNPIAQRPFAPAPGRPPLVPQKSVPIETVASRAAKEVPPKLLADYNQVLKKPLPAPVLRDVAATFAQAGLPVAASVVADKAKTVTKAKALGVPTISRPFTPPAMPVHLESHAEKSPGGVVVTANPPGWTLPVKTVQTALITLGLLTPTQANGRPSDDGIRGRDTDQSVRFFQNKSGIQPVDGIVGVATAAAIKTAVIVAKAAKASLPATVSGADDLGPTLTPPGWAIDVRSAQKALVALNRLGFFQVSGVPDPATRGAILDFQAGNRLPATGIADAPTAKLLVGAANLNVAVGSPMAPWRGGSVPLEAIYGSYPMNRYAKIWGYWPWP